MQLITLTRGNETMNRMMNSCGTMCCSMMCMCMDTAYLRMRFSSDIQGVW